MKDRVCTSCGFEGKPIKQCMASFFVDALIWGAVGSFALSTGLMPLLLVPAAWTAYHLMKFGTTKCPQCGDLEMVSNNFDRRILGKDVADNYTFHVLHKSGEHRLVNMFVKLITFRDKPAVIATLKDITEIQKFENKLILEKEKAEQTTISKSLFLL